MERKTLIHAISDLDGFLLHVVDQKEIVNFRKKFLIGLKLCM